MSGIACAAQCCLKSHSQVHVDLDPGVSSLPPVEEESTWGRVMMCLLVLLTLIRLTKPSTLLDLREVPSGSLLRLMDLHYFDPLAQLHMDLVKTLQTTLRSTSYT